MSAEREKVKALREAFVNGAWEQANYAYTHIKHEPLEDVIARMKTMAAAYFPMPKVERYRIRVDEYGVSWRVVSERAEFRIAGTHLWNAVFDYKPGLSITAKRVSLWHDLYTNPTELVEGDE